MCFDTAKSKISTNAAIPAKKYGFTKQKHIRGDKTLKIQNFGPNVGYISFQFSEVVEELDNFSQHQFGQFQKKETVEQVKTYFGDFGRIFFLTSKSLLNSL